MARILVIDDDLEFSASLQDQLRRLGHDVRCLDMADEALALLAAREHFDVVLLDNKMPRMSGIEFLAALKQKAARVPVILMTSAHNDQTVFDAMNNGATDYVIKPLSFDAILAELQPALDDALALGRPLRQVQFPDAAEPLPREDSTIIGRGKAILHVLKAIGRLAELDETVLILGETGTGKDLVARAIHTNSRRKDRPFVVMNCTAFNENLLDDELFGHEPGAFTGAGKLRKGRFEHAHGGTLFLDEVGDMPLTLQAKLLRVLENREVIRVGSNEPIRVDVRVVAATHRDLKVLVQERTFRQDLFYRLEGMTIHLPPLRERQEDIELLARHFLGRLLDSTGSRLIHPDALERLRRYSWPGNIRQLQKVLCRAVANCRGEEITAEDLDFGEFSAPVQKSEANDQASVQGSLLAAIAAAWNSGQTDLWPVLQQQLEKELLHFAARQPKLSQVQLAKRLGIARNTLRARIEQYGLEEAAGDGD
jgi:two-component system response regulator HydG